MLLHTRGSDLVHGLLDNVRNTNLGVAVSWVNTHFAYFFATQKLPYESIWIKIFKVYIYDILLHIFSSLKFTRILQCVSRQGVKCFFKMISSKLLSNLCWFFLLDLFLKGLPKPFESCLLEDMEKYTQKTFFVFQDLLKTSWRGLQHKNSSSTIHLANRNWRCLKMFWKTKKCYTEEVLNTSYARRMFAGSTQVSMVDLSFFLLKFLENNLININRENGSIKQNYSFKTTFIFQVIDLGGWSWCYVKLGIILLYKY